MKMKTVYEANPALGDPMSIQVNILKVIEVKDSSPVFLIRANWRKMGTDWTSWDQIYGDIRCDSKILEEWWKTDWVWPRDGLRKLRGELPGVLRALWAAAAMATAAVRGDLQCQMRSRAWAGEVPMSLFWKVSWFVFFQVCLWLKC